MTCFFQLLKKCNSYKTQIIIRIIFYSKNILQNVGIRSALLGNCAICIEYALYGGIYEIQICFPKLYCILSNEM